MRGDRLIFVRWLIYKSEEKEVLQQKPLPAAVAKVIFKLKMLLLQRQHF